MSKRIILAASVLCALLLVTGCSTTDSYWTLPLMRNVDISNATSLEGLCGGFIVCLFIDLCLLPITAAHDLWLVYKLHPGEFPSNKNNDEINWYERIMGNYK